MKEKLDECMKKEGEGMMDGWMGEGTDSRINDWMDG